MEISRLWIAMLTRNSEYSGTDSQIILGISDDSGFLLNHTFSDTKQYDQERGEANLYEVNVVGKNIVPEHLSSNAITIGINGDDMWQPEHIMVWGGRTHMFETTVIPLAVETNITWQLSTDSNEGFNFHSIRSVIRGNRDMLINRLFVFSTTAGNQPGGPFGTVGDVEPGTNDPLEIQIVDRGRLAVLFEIKKTFQSDLDAGLANFYSCPVITPFRKRDLHDRSITLRIKGLDQWKPESMFIFGLNTANGRPERIVPLVHLPEWTQGYIKPDPTNGIASINLPLTPEPMDPQDYDTIFYDSD
jgi:hypothetical protein